MRRGSQNSWAMAPPGITAGKAGQIRPSLQILQCRPRLRRPRSEAELPLPTVVTQMRTFAC
jgi:hypothetical protein